MKAALTSDTARGARSDRGGGLRRLVGLQQPARDLDADTLGVVLGDDAARQVAVDLAQLVAVDLHVIGRRRFGRRALAQQRKHHQPAHRKRQIRRR